jgi:hypothetical protein
MAYVYRHIRLDKNEPFYIGIGSDSNGNHKRAYQNKDRRNKIWNDIVNKTDYKVDILFDDITIKEAIKKEIEFIELYGRISFGNGTLANLTDGGDGVSGYVHTNESKKKMSECRSGSNNSMYGRSGVLAPWFGKKWSIESRIKLSKSRIGKNNPMYGRTGECAPSSKLVLDTFTGIYYISCKEAAETIGISYKRLVRYLNGTRKNKTNLIYV